MSVRYAEKFPWRSRRYPTSFSPSNTSYCSGQYPPPSSLYFPICIFRPNTTLNRICAGSVFFHHCYPGACRLASTLYSFKLPNYQSSFLSIYLQSSGISPVGTPRKSSHCSSVKSGIVATRNLAQ